VLFLLRTPPTPLGTTRLADVTPSMRMAVKPHQAFFLAAQTDHAAGLVPVPRRVPALFPSLRPHAVRLAVWPGGTPPPSAGVRLGPGARPERPSIRVRPATAPSTLYRIRLERPARLEPEPTHRTNGAFAGTPGGTTAALSDSAFATPTATLTSPSSGDFAPVLDPSPALHQLARRLGVPPGGRPPP